MLDVFQRVKKFPSRGAKGFIDTGARTRPPSAGGVCLNQLAWASAIAGAPTALLACLPTPDADPRVAIITEEMRRLGIDDRWVLRDSGYKLPSSLVFTEGRGQAVERTIMMDRGSTADISAETVEQAWGDALSEASLVVTEISQLPLGSVTEVLARGSRGITMLDVDIDPWSACSVDDAGLGTHHELAQCLALPNVVKISRPVASTLCEFLVGSKHNKYARLAPETLLHTLARALPRPPNLLVITDGPRTTWALSDSMNAVSHHPPGVSSAVDVTGCGDAFTGGCLSWMWKEGRVPRTNDDIHDMLDVANAFGALCGLVENATVPPGNLESFRKSAAEANTVLAKVIPDFAMTHPKECHVV